MITLDEVVTEVQALTSAGWSFVARPKVTDEPRTYSTLTQEAVTDHGYEFAAQDDAITRAVLRAAYGPYRETGRYTSTPEYRGVRVADRFFAFKDGWTVKGVMAPEEADRILELAGLTREQARAALEDAETEHEVPSL